jgi:hypothetical protein
MRSRLTGYLHFGIEYKRLEVMHLEDEALRLRRSPSPRRPPGRPASSPKAGMSLREIDQQLGRSEHWASLAVAAPERREHAAGSGHSGFDGSILALRKFTSSELLDAGLTSAWSPSGKDMAPKSSRGTTRSLGHRTSEQRGRTSGAASSTKPTDDASVPQLSAQDGRPPSDPMISR